MFLRKLFALSVCALLLVTAQQSMAQIYFGQGDILVVSNQGTGNNGGRYAVRPGVWAWPTHDGVTTQTHDQSYIDLLSAWFPNAVTTSTQIVPDERGLLTLGTVDTANKVAWLNSYDLIILADSVGSGDVRNSPHREVWNQQISVPIISTKSFHLNAGRWNYVQSTATGSNIDTTTDTEILTINAGMSSHPVFSGIDVTSGCVRLYEPGPYTDPPTEWLVSSAPGAVPFDRIATRPWNVWASNNLGVSLCNFQGWETQFPNNLVLGIWDTPTTAGTTYWIGGTQFRGGKRAFFTLNDDRNSVLAGWNGVTPSPSTVAYDCLTRLAPEGERLIQNLIVYLVPTLPASMSDFKIE